jgi:molybdopterin converting factor small subunit
VATLRLFGPIADLAGTRREVIDALTVDEALHDASERFGSGFDDLLESCQIWVNGEPADGSWPLTEADELAVLPPLSGG